MRLKIGVFASHGGSNMQAIIDACRDGTIDGEVSVVICNNSTAYAVDRARAAGIPVYHLSGSNYPDADDLDEAMLLVLEKHKVNLVVLAGYMKKMSPAILKKFSNRVLNIHPALLPRHGGSGMYGMKVHEAVIADEDTETGATVHLVNDKYDDGSILGQVVVKVEEEDTPDILAKKVLPQEHMLYVETLRRIASGELKI
ncbi:MAG: phosphoribosylglycinamide formyltransferase [Clostridia bacterium]|nr:phosphoribosylglycinamide formyltransferase [Clostridia bacterium]MBN2881901.1 phosphoribosylglycinamide formyltransferase [Clostridia bacterium]